MKAKILASPCIREGVTVHECIIPESVATFLKKHCFTASVYALENSTDSWFDWGSAPQQIIDAITSTGEIEMDFMNGDIKLLSPSTNSGYEIDTSTISFLDDFDPQVLALDPNTAHTPIRTLQENYQSFILDKAKQCSGVLLTIITSDYDIGHTVAVKIFGDEAHFFDPASFRTEQSTTHSHFHYSGKLNTNNKMTFESGVSATLIEYLTRTFNPNKSEYAILAHTLLFPNQLNR